MDSVLSVHLCISKEKHGYNEHGYNELGYNEHIFQS